MEKHVDRNTSSHYCTEMIRGKTQQTINGKNGGASRPASAKLPQWPHFTKIQSTSWIKHSFSKRKTDMERKHIKLHILHVLLLLLNISGSDVSQTHKMSQFSSWTKGFFIHNHCKVLKINYIILFLIKTKVQYINTVFPILLI